MADRYAVDKLVLSRIPELVRASGRKTVRALARELGYHEKRLSVIARTEGYIANEELGRILLTLELYWGCVTRIELQLARGRSGAANSYRHAPAKAVLPW